ncbi:glycosyltransferase family 4 protein [Jeotgalibaca sp. A122]|uniref:glycosyltransferase family 4 protein n=1 Tax=Jeotgalibaca sp. A122 TaxID=3457322 RepID=UPI003FD10917
MKKALVLASVASMIDQFNRPNIMLLQNLGYEVHVLANFQEAGTISNSRAQKVMAELRDENIKVYDVDIHRKPFNKGNINAYNQIKQIMADEKYALVHCHSPIGGVLARLAARGQDSKVIYTAHGFHFFKGGPLSSWLIYYPVERWLSRFTDVLITINKQDLKRAKNFNMKNLAFIPGVGLDTQKFDIPEIDTKQKREELGLKTSDFVVLSVGELTKRKNHQVIIKAIHEIAHDDIHYLICGRGPEKQNLEKLIAELGLSKQVHLLGYRTDIEELNQISDVFAFPSRREGLGIAALEAMAAGLPILTSDVQGIPDYSVTGVTGYLYGPDDVAGYKEGITTLYDNRQLAREIGLNNKEAVKKYDIKNVNVIMNTIYSEI